MFGTKRIKQLEGTVRLKDKTIAQWSSLAHARGDKIQQLESELKVLRFIGPGVFDPLVSDPEPRDAKERAGYVTTVSSFFRQFFEQKLVKMIAEVRGDLDSTLGID